MNNSVITKSHDVVAQIGFCNEGQNDWNHTLSFSNANYYRTVSLFQCESRIVPYNMCKGDLSCVCRVFQSCSWPNLCFWVGKIWAPYLSFVYCLPITNNRILWILFICMWEHILQHFYIVMNLFCIYNENNKSHFLLVSWGITNESLYNLLTNHLFFCDAQMIGNRSIKNIIAMAVIYCKISFQY
jgi:hypothetical protein